LTSAAGVIYESYRREQEVAKLSIERKQGDEALKASQASFHNVVERTDDGIVVVDPDGMVLYVNRSAVFLLGRPAGELVGSRFGFPLVAGEVTEFDVLPLKQEPRIAEMRVVKTEWDGVPAFLASLRDITERKRDEETIRETNLRLTDALDRLKETQEQVIQQERLRALGEMASGFAHDFNNALSPVVGYSELLLMSDKNLEDKEKLKGFLSLINTAGQDASKVVSRLREFYRYREDNEIFLPTLLNQLVEQAVDLTRPRWKDLAQARGADIQIETELGDIPPIAGNESELREMLTNLIFNAVDAMPDGGAITIATRLEEGKIEDFGTGEWKTMGEEGTGDRRLETEDRRPETGDRSENAGLAIRPTTRPDAADSSNIQSSIVNIQSHESHVVLEVSDTGTGMTEDVRRKCLEPFFSTKGNEGTGLGLAMVFGIIDRHDGKIEIQSELGSGTTLIIRLPIQTEKKTEVGQPDSEIVVSRSLHVLIVDDEEHVLDILSEFLTMDGHTVESANNGREGLEKFHTGRFDLVVTDRAMPEMSGDQLAATIKRMAPDKPIIMLTGFGNMMKASEEDSPGVDYILSKPTKIAEFRKAIWTVVRIANPLR
jgi:signal transduction histidine kinase/ActR/RegA family two-component response regulator